MKRGKRKAEEEVYGAYLLPHRANRGKLRRLEGVLHAYRRAARALKPLHLRRFFQTGRLFRFLEPTGIASPLSDRYLWVVSQHVVDVLSGHLEGLKERVRGLVLSLDLPEERRRNLLTLNALGAWLWPEVLSALREGRPFLLRLGKDKSDAEEKTLLVPPEDLQLLLTLFRRARKERPWPRMDRLQLHLDGRVARLAKRGEGRKAKATHFPAWLHVATLEPRQRVALPLLENPHGEGVPGEWRNFFQVVFDGEEVRIYRMKALAKRAYTPKTERLALDVGLSPLLATDRGDLLGRGFLKALLAYDREIQAIARKAQREGKRLREVPAYREAVRRLRGFLQNEVNRLLNRLITLHAPATLVVERLDLSSPELSRRMNRLVSNFGKRYLKAKLERLRELYGIEVVEVNPAYSSQECARCGYVDPRNRQDTQSFRCLACGHRGNAQVNAARNLLRRSSPGSGITPFTPKRQALRVLLQEYVERHQGRWSAARGQAWATNPYAKGFPDLLRTPGVEKRT